MGDLIPVESMDFDEYGDEGMVAGLGSSVVEVHEVGADEIRVEGRPIVLTLFTEDVAYGFPTENAETEDDCVQNRIWLSRTSAKRLAAALNKLAHGL